jgi:hypothetical protein
MSVQSDMLTFLLDENAPLVGHEIKKQCMYFHGSFALYFQYFLFSVYVLDNGNRIDN